MGMSDLCSILSDSYSLSIFLIDHNIFFCFEIQTDGTFAVSSLGVVTLQQRLNAALTSSYSVAITISVSQ